MIYCSPFIFTFTQVTLSENVQKVIELSQRTTLLCSVDKTVIQTIEETQNATRTTEQSIENVRRVVLNDNNSGIITESTREISRESNGDIHTETHKETFNEMARESTSGRNPSKRSSSFKSVASSSSLGDFFNRDSQKPTREQSVSEFSIPYNIINNYFSVGVVSARVHTQSCKYT